MAQLLLSGVAPLPSSPAAVAPLHLRSHLGMSASASVWPHPPAAWPPWRRTTMKIMLLLLLVRDFDPGAAPPFGLADIRAAIPKHCWVKDPWRSMGYVLRDVVVVFALAAAAARLHSCLAWPLYWAAQGTMFWALFVLGHDCGHGSFSNNSRLNSVMGHILHSSILVPYHGWRISHRTHHQNHGHVDKDESWHPLPERLYRSLDRATRMLRFSIPLPHARLPILPVVSEPRKVWFAFPSQQRPVPAQRKERCADIHSVLGGHGCPSSQASPSSWDPSSCSTSTLSLTGFFCYVAGLRHLLAPSRPQRQAALVPWQD
ncbi:hypothetical protein EE612_041557 [Oryza sativa]|nr:hypothetical protein EE612_041557 [Oryza sativa]